MVAETLTPTQQKPPTPERRTYPHTFVVGNEKGGTGKSTTTMHVIAGLLANGYSVGSIDLDARQGTLTRYMENRQEHAARYNVDLPMPDHIAVLPSRNVNYNEATEEENLAFTAAMESLISCDAIVIDTPGRDSNLSRLGHRHANTLITPINDSFVDLDVLAVVDPVTYAVKHPSKYSEMVFQEKIARARQTKINRTFDWVVMRNRLSQLDSRNQQAMSQAVEALSKRIGFRVLPGFSERVVFRELFLNGLTLLDLGKGHDGPRMNMSHVAARQELRELLTALGLREIAV